MLLNTNWKINLTIFGNNKFIIEIVFFQFKKVVNVLAALLADTLQSRNYIAKYEAFHTYASLAQFPSLGKICQQTLVMAPNLASTIRSYFSKVSASSLETIKKNCSKHLWCLYFVIGKSFPCFWSFSKAVNVLIYKVF